MFLFNSAGTFFAFIGGSLDFRPLSHHHVVVLLGNSFLYMFLWKVSIVALCICSIIGQYTSLYCTCAG